MTAREVLLAGCIPKGKDLGDDAPRLVKPKAPHTHSLQAVAQRLGVNVDRLRAAARRNTPYCGEWKEYTIKPKSSQSSQQ